MACELTFKEVCEIIKKDQKQESELIKAVDKLLGMAMVCSPLFSPSVAAILPALATKNELVKIGEYVFDKLTNKKDDDYLARQQRMQAAYSLLVFTAFFDALDKALPDKLREKIGLLESEKIQLAQEAHAKTCGSQPNTQDTDKELVPANIHLPLVFPHPTESLDQQLERHARLWQELAQGFQSFITKLALWDDADEKARKTIAEIIDKTPKKAAQCFEAQYFELARRYDDFAVWSNLQEHKATQSRLTELSDFVQRYAELSQSGPTTIDVGFAKLNEIILGIPETLKVSQAEEIVDGLKKHYSARINEAIIKDDDEADEGQPRLNFPRVRDAFIPQSYFVLRQMGKPKRFEDEATWKDLPRKDNLGAFLLSYLSSPFSTETPLIVLGHPGSGKSLLTHVLSAQLMSRQYTAIRVPLREVDAEAGVIGQIEQRLRAITNRSMDPWAKLSGAFKNSPPIVILDGYDELLQASGKVFASYLKEAQNFQQSEAEQGRPVCVIVTSRVTLIDKATIPYGSTIVRLLEFDPRQQQRWISIWNTANAGYFHAAKVDAFELPDEKERGAKKILELAKQPLLLLMLALYDSQGNKLRKSKSLDRTELYNSLLRRFIDREKKKDKAFEDKTLAEKNKTLDVEMQRLGVVALGMYNRRSLHILSQQLNDDLKFFNLERENNVTSGRPLSQADLLLGSFFFVHKSEMQYQAGVSEHHEETTAFEFLHNTFGEFLTADFVLRRAVKEVKSLKKYKEDEDLRENLARLLNNADGFSRDWFASLIYTPLFTRPVVLEMMREWIKHLLHEAKLEKAEFLNHLDTIIINQLERLLSKREMPPIFWKETVEEHYRATFGDHPLLGHIAVYSLNLILLRVIVGDGTFVFDEEKIKIHEDGTRPWDRLVHIWRSWFSLDNLNGITAILQGESSGSRITLKAKEQFQAAESRERLPTCLNVALSLADNVGSGLTGLLMYDANRDAPLPLATISAHLDAEQFNPGLMLAMQRLFQAERYIEDYNDLETFGKTANTALKWALDAERSRELGHIALSIRNVLKRLSQNEQRNLHLFPPMWRLLRDLLDPERVCEIARFNPEAALILYQTTKEVGDMDWGHRFLREVTELMVNMFRRGDFLERFPKGQTGLLALFQKISEDFSVKYLCRKIIHPEYFERAFDPRYLYDLAEHSPEAALVWLQLAREAGGAGFVERFGKELLRPEYFERAFEFDSRYLFDLAERSPKVALAWLQLAREAGGAGFVKRFGKELLRPEYFERAFDPRYFFELAERSPEAALAWLQLAREVGGADFIERFDKKFIHSEFFERAFDPRYLLELAEHSPETALARLQLAREIGGAGFVERFDKKFIHAEFFERAFDPHYLLELAKRSPETALAWLQLAQEFGGEGFFFGRFDKKLMRPEFFERALDPSYLLELAERSPETALAWLQLAQEISGGQLKQLMRKFGGDNYGQYFNAFSLRRLLKRKPAAITVILDLARGTESTQIIAAISSYLLQELATRQESKSVLNSAKVFFSDRSKSFLQPAAKQSVLASLPLSALPDLRWLAEQTEDPTLKAALDALV